MNKTPCDLGDKSTKQPSYFDALIPLIMLVMTVAGSVGLFGLDAMNGALQVGIMLVVMMTIFILLKNGHTWDDISHAGKNGVASIVGAIFILLSVGALIGSWNLSGTIPTLIYYGITTISPDWFYPIAFFVCSITSLSIGSSWTTAGTVGVGLIGLSQMLGLPAEITAGAVISGAYVGDKLSPLSETSLLAAQINDVPIYEHIAFQTKTTLPTAIIALVIFWAIGVFGIKPNIDDALVNSELKQFQAIYNISLWNLLPLVLLVFLSMRKVPAMIAILISSLFACFLSFFLQPSVLENFSKHLFETDSMSIVMGIKACWYVLTHGFSIDSGIPAMDILLSRGGMQSMLLTIWLIIVAITFGTLVDEFGLLNKLVTPILLKAKTIPRLVISVVLTALGLNATTGDQYIALLLPSKLYKAEFNKRGLANKQLSRTVADASIVTSPLVPWNSCGAYMSAVLGVSTLSYLPFAFFNILAPIITILFALFFHPTKQNSTISEKE